MKALNSGFLVVTLLLFGPCHCLGQNKELASQVIKLVNEARTQPSLFLSTHQKEITKIKPQYLSVLQNAKPVVAIVWDMGLEEMARQVVESNELNPTYKGTNKLCGFSSGRSAGTISKDALEYVCDIYTNVHDRDYKYLGIYFNKDLTGYSFQWGITCDRENVKYEYRDPVDTTAVEFDKLNTARNEKYLTSVEKWMVMEVNLVRAYPKVYAKIVAKYLSDESNGRWGLTRDTYDAGMELIDELNNMTPCAILQPRECVYNAARQHGLDCEKRGFFNHTGSDDSNPWDRILKQCTAFQHGNENGAGNAAENPRKPVIALLLDDGISTRGHRRNMLDDKWRYIGCYRYIGEKTTYYTLYQWIQNFAY